MKARTVTSPVVFLPAVCLLTAVAWLSLQPIAAAGAADARQAGTLEPPSTAAELAELTTAIAADLDAYWTRAFGAEGRYYARPSIVLIEGVTPTPCAWDGAVGAGAGSFYCPWNGTIYVDVSTLLAEGGRYGAAGLVFTLAHEWGHHAQFQRGDLQERSASVELAADCLAGAYLADAVARGRFAAETVEERVSAVAAALGDARGVAPLDAAAHGSGAQRAAMLRLGYVEGAAACVA